jgi:hypothetical protein
MACLYQNMMMQQGPMAWMQAMCSQQQQSHAPLFTPPEVDSSSRTNHLQKIQPLPSSMHQSQTFHSPFIFMKTVNLCCRHST